MKPLLDFPPPPRAVALGTIAVLGRHPELAQVLKRAGYHVSTVANADSLRVLAATQPIALVIVETDEQSKTAIEDADLWPSAARRPAVLLISSDFNARTVVNLARVGDMAVPAPLAPETLLAAVNLLLARRDEVASFASAYELSPRETDLLRHAVLGLNNDEAAAALGCGRGTVSTFWHRIFKKTGVSGQRDVMVLLLRSISGSGSFRIVPRST